MDCKGRFLQSSVPSLSETCYCTRLQLGITAILKAPGFPQGQDLPTGGQEGSRSNQDIHSCEEAGLFLGRVGSLILINNGNKDCNSSGGKKNKREKVRRYSLWSPR